VRTIRRTDRATGQTDVSPPPIVPHKALTPRGSMTRGEISFSEHQSEPVEVVLERKDMTSTRIDEIQ
jgi:hypothetical protein